MIPFLHHFLAFSRNGVELPRNGTTGHRIWPGEGERTATVNFGDHFAEKNRGVVTTACAHMIACV